MTYEIGDRVAVRGHFPPGETGVIERTHFNKDTGETQYDVMMSNGANYKKMEKFELKKVGE